jgi:hypothetical protein
MRIDEITTNEGLLTTVSTAIKTGIKNQKKAHTARGKLQAQKERARAKAAEEANRKQLRKDAYAKRRSAEEAELGGETDWKPTSKDVKK